MSSAQMSFGIIFFDKDADAAVGMNSFAETCFSDRFKVGDTLRDLERVLEIEFGALDQLEHSKSRQKFEVTLRGKSKSLVSIAHEKINSPHYESFALVFFE